MAIVFGGGGPKADPDDDKARKTHALCIEWWARLSDPAFTAKLPRGAQAQIKAAVDKVWFNLAIYRGELSKGQRRQTAGSPAALATTTTAGGGGVNPAAAAVQALAILAAAAIAVLVVAATKGALGAGQALEASLSSLQSTSEATAVIMTPVPLNFSPGISGTVLNQLISKGVIVVTGGLMAISITKLRDFIDGLRGVVKDVAANLCVAEVAALTSILDELTILADEFEKMLTEGITQAVRDAMTKSVMDLVAKASKAAEALSECLSGATFGPSPGKPPTGAPN